MRNNPDNERSSAQQRRVLDKAHKLQAIADWGIQEMRNAVLNHPAGSHGFEFDFPDYDNEELAVEEDIYGLVRCHEDIAWNARCRQEKDVSRSQRKLDYRSADRALDIDLEILYATITYQNVNPEVKPTQGRGEQHSSRQPRLVRAFLEG